MMSFVVVGLVIWIITGVLTLSLNFQFLVALLVDLAILLIEVHPLHQLHSITCTIHAS